MEAVKSAARSTAGVIAAAALAATPLAAAVPVHAQDVQYVVYDYDYSSDHITIDGFTAYEIIKKPPYLRPGKAVSVFIIPIL